MPAASTRRRLSCLLYEGVIVFGIVMMAGLAYSVATNQRHALQGQAGLQIWVFLVLGTYFVWFWTKHGQTLPMRTWHIKLLTTAGVRAGPWRCACRFVVSWLWFLPSLAFVRLSGLQGPLAVVVVMLAGILCYALLGRLHPRRQLLHDMVCGTVLVDTRESGTSGS